jgi:DNA-binding response OmpR family regulator
MNGKISILIVDDDRDLAESLADVLEARGYAVELAGSGEEGVARFQQQDFDLVFTDVKLPGMNGVESFFAFRKIKPDAKVVMMTGFSVEQLLAQAIENGALAVLHKPFAIPEILAVLERIKPHGVVPVTLMIRLCRQHQPVLRGAATASCWRLLAGGRRVKVWPRRRSSVSDLGLPFQRSEAHLPGNGKTGFTIVDRQDAGRGATDMAVLRTMAEASPPNH